MKWVNGDQLDRNVEYCYDRHEIDINNIQKLAFANNIIVKSSIYAGIIMKLTFDREISPT